MKPNLMRMTKTLKEQWQLATAGLHANPHVGALVSALNEGRFNFAREPWHSANGEMANELLLRVWVKDGQRLNRFAALSAIAEDGSFPALNRFLVYSALGKIEPGNKETLSINLLPSAAASPIFWEELEKSLNGHKHQDIIFEILEHEDSYPVDPALLKAAKDKGYRFALDDFAADDLSWQRLADFGPHLDFIKLDGPLVRKGLEDRDPILKETIQRLRAEYPKAQIVAEFVQSDLESKELYDMGVTAVQGNRLAKSVFSTVRPIKPGQGVPGHQPQGQAPL